MADPTIQSESVTTPEPSAWHPDFTAKADYAYGANNFTGSGGFTSSSGVVSASTLTSTVAIGTAPLTVTSTTMVAHLNADLLDGQQGSYYAVASTSVPYTGATTTLQLATRNLTTTTGWIGNCVATPLALLHSDTLNSAQYADDGSKPTWLLSYNGVQVCNMSMGTQYTMLIANPYTGGGAYAGGIYFRTGGLTSASQRLGIDKTGIVNVNDSGLYILPTGKVGNRWETPTALFQSDAAKDSQYGNDGSKPTWLLSYNGDQVCSFFMGTSYEINIANPYSGGGAWAGGIHFQTGGLGTAYERLTISKAGAIDAHAGAVTTTGTVTAAFHQTSTAITANSTGTVTIVAKDANLLTANAGWLPFKKSDGTTVYVPYWA